MIITEKMKGAVYHEPYELFGRIGCAGCGIFPRLGRAYGDVSKLADRIMPGETAAAVCSERKHVGRTILAAICAIQRTDL